MFIFQIKEFPPKYLRTHSDSVGAEVEEAQVAHLLEAADLAQLVLGDVQLLKTAAGAHRAHIADVVVREVQDGEELQRAEAQRYRLHLVVVQLELLQQGQRLGALHRLNQAGAENKILRE